MHHLRSLRRRRRPRRWPAVAGCRGSRGRPAAVPRRLRRGSRLRPRAGLLLPHSLHSFHCRQSALALSQVLASVQLKHVSQVSMCTLAKPPQAYCCCRARKVGPSEGSVQETTAYERTSEEVHTAVGMRVEGALGPGVSSSSSLKSA